MNKKLNILVINYNKPDMTANLMTDLLKQDTVFKLELVENVDNKSIHTLWNLHKNLNTLPYICFLNNDVRVTPNFVSDTVKVFEENSSVGIVVHATNLDHFNDTLELLYAIPPNRIMQGWDFSIRKELMPRIPECLHTFSGDAYVFSKVQDMGYNVAILYSSPILHYGSSTVFTIDNIQEIFDRDQEAYRVLQESEHLGEKPARTVTFGYSEDIPSQYFTRKFLK